jgi:hypothetical protein
VTFIDGFLKDDFKGYVQMLNKDDRIASRVFILTVWDPRHRTAGRPRFTVGAVYKLNKIHQLKFYHDMLQGCLQSVGAANPGLIEEFLTFEAAKRARMLDSDRDQREGEDDEADMV